MRLTSRRAQWGRPVTGSLVLTAGDEYLRVDHLRARLVERKEDLDCGDEAVPRRLGAVHARADWANNVWLEPHQQREWPFELRAPWERSFAHLWDVQGTVWLVGGGRTSQLEPLEMGPPPVFEAIAAAAAGIAGWEVGRWRFDAPYACVELPAKGEWRPFVEGLILRLQRVRSNILGDVRAVLPPGRGGRRLRTAVLLAAQPVSFYAPKHDLDAMERALAEALAPLLAEHSRAVYGSDDLPLPAAASPDVALLPGPSQIGPSSAEDDR
ncbi:MAG: sporulation protein [Actinomycetota bacterium]